MLLDWVMGLKKCRVEVVQRSQHNYFLFLKILRRKGTFKAYVCLNIAKALPGVAVLSGNWMFSWYGLKA